MNWFYVALKFFSEDQKTQLIANLTEQKFRRCDVEEQDKIIYLYSRLKFLTANEIDLVYDFTLRRFLQEENTLVYEVPKGEDFEIYVIKRPMDSYSGFLLTVREHASGELISEDPSPANEDEIQIIKVIDFDLSEGRFFKLRVCLERIDENGLASGNAVSLLGFIYVLVAQNIDSLPPDNPED